jgi:hypothetical protein
MGGLLRFESGSLGFSFLRAFHIREILQLGPPPALDARNMGAMRKQEERTAQPKEEEPQPVPPLNYRGWTIFGLEIVQAGSPLLSFTLMVFGAPAEGRPGWAKLGFLGPTRVIFSRFNYLHQGLLSRIEEISLRQIVPGRRAIASPLPASPSSRSRRGAAPRSSGRPLRQASDASWFGRTG